MTRILTDLICHEGERCPLLLAFAASYEKKDIFMTNKKRMRNARL